MRILCLAAGGSGAAASPVCSVCEQLRFLRMGMQRCFGERAVLPFEACTLQRLQATLVGCCRLTHAAVKLSRNSPALLYILGCGCFVTQHQQMHPAGCCALLAGLE